MVTAKEIQQEVLSAQEELLRDALTLVNGANENIAHCANLRGLGFGGSAVALEKRMEESKVLAGFADMYSFEYPGLKFIPKKAMQDVCEKYGLVVGHVSKYIGEVPAWALARIAANKRHIGTMQVFDEDTYEKRVQFQREAMMAQVGDDVEMRRFVRMSMMDSYVDMNMGMKADTNLVIACPKADMSVSHYERIRNGEIEADPRKTNHRLTLDPIVCLFVPGGYIVLAAWGEEGQDPRVFNAENN